ncbi:MAG TPA: hypothetical protein VH877_09055 [Polyangia bacterium]|jgi:hypothetical protein|nr:hypothetical protein [Polyangia bacterium]
MSKKIANQITASSTARKTPRTAATAAPVATAPAASQSEETLPGVAAKDRRFLERVGRFLVYVHVPDLLGRAASAGYTTEEHSEGWRLYYLAGGANVPLDQLLANERFTVAKRIANGGATQVIEELDRFENIWFPRTRAIIRRMVPAAEREAFAGAFFRNLDQQPLGPAVIGSVSTFLERVQGLEQSQDPAAARVRAALTQRGLDAATVETMQGLIAQVQMGPGSVPAGNAADIPQVRAQQVQALGALHDWYNDWGTTLRTVFTRRELIRLGLVQVRAAADDEEDEDGKGDEGKGKGDEGKTEPPSKSQA